MQKKEIKKSKRDYKKRRRRIARLCGLFFVCFLFIYGGIYGMLYYQVSKIPKDKACEGVYVGQVDISGLTEKQAQKAIDDKAEEYKKLNFTFQSGEQSSQAALGELGFDIVKEESLIRKAVKYGNDGGVWNRYFKLIKLKKEKKVFVPVYEVAQKTAAEVLTERAGGLLEGASNAVITRTDGAFTIADEKEGVELDTKATVKKLRIYLNNDWDGKEGTIPVVSKTQTPTVTRADLETIQDNLGTFSTYCGSGQARVTNIIRGAELINGTVLMPGQEFSAGQTMMPFTTENKYVEAGAYENGEVVASVAGGICQVSTTLYNAAINAELDIVSRQPHSMVVNYVKPSRDAAIAGDYKDLKIRNNYDTPIFIEGYISEGNVIFNIYGKETRPSGRELKFISETVEIEEPTKKFVAKEDSEIGVIKEPENVNKGRKAQLWKVVYENGKEVSRDIFNKSTYKPSAYKVMVGTASTNPEYTKIMKNAIKTQSEEKIKTAIEEVKAKQAAEAQPEAEQPQ